AVTPLGNSVAEFWDALIRGESGAAPTTGFEVSDLETRFSCQVKDFDPGRTLDRKLARRLDPFAQFALVAAQQAIADAGIDTSSLSEGERDRFGVVFGSGIGGLAFAASQAQVLDSRGPAKVSPFFVPMIAANIAAGLIAIEHRLRGPNHCVVSACATGNHNLGDALLLLRHGYADAIVAGGAEHVHRIGLAGFAAMRAMSTRNDSPETASRPCDRTRDGLVAGEGAGALILETEDHAVARGARIYAEVAGIGTSADAYHFAAPEPEGRGAALAIRNALGDAGVEPRQVDYVNLHATSTPQGDVAETRAIKEVFGDHAYRVGLSATKSTTGHLFGAAGAVEGIATILTIVHGMIPPTINLSQPDPECDLDYTADKAKACDVRIGLSNAFGFGGHNSSVVFRQWTAGP
ncbi:MAG: beta-ketoacyl-ACP synthase II, partial [Thermoanaerobaculia bacterium]